MTAHTRLALRLTPQRRAVLEALRASHDHPTAAELLSRVQQRSPGVGPATVYRTLGLLVRSGLAIEVNIGDGGGARYDGNTGPHDHLVCTRCRRVVDIVQPRPDLSGVAGTGFAVTGYDLLVYGICPDCQERWGTADAEETYPC
ncbi:MAG: transcriptional repressor [Streptosporangiales bacterium]|nr:transcriptional repressor [Streptosporangiales bacterium]